MSELKLISDRHQRHPWGHVGDTMIYVHKQLGLFNGKGSYSKEDLAHKAAQTELYSKAKYECDHDAAAQLVAEAINPKKLDEIAELVANCDVDPIIVFPHPSFDDDEADGHIPAEHSKITNAIPFAFGAYLAQSLGATTELNVVQSARVGRTKLSKFARFLWQPKFSGPIVPRRPYIIADDVVTQGGTIASLRCHILDAGGTVLCCTALAHQTGENVKLAVARGTLDVLEQTYGSDLAAFWKDTIGHDTHCLTEQEVVRLIAFGEEQKRTTQAERLQCLRDRLAKAAAKGA
jgi:hypothetical protein